jgi:ABC-type branched-subunit amino acid transport system ATPase component
MGAAMVNVEIEGFLVKIEQTPIHALIGPNGSGKRSIFTALRTEAEPPVDTQRAAEQKQMVDVVMAVAEGHYQLLTGRSLADRIAAIAWKPLFLIQEPENGVHPAMIEEMMRSFRAISQVVPILIITYSPLVVNELKGHEVTIVVKPSSEPMRTILLKDVPGFERAMKVYAPGEFWLTYADGVDERALLTGSGKT